MDTEIRKVSTSHVVKIKQWTIGQHSAWNVPLISAVLVNKQDY